MPESDERCWLELDEIFSACGRGDLTKPQGEANTEYASESPPGESRPGFASREMKSARAREVFVAALAEWVDIRDVHRHFALCPSFVQQSCATIGKEHSTQQRVSCNKLCPRKILLPGRGEIAEDPGRRDLYRLSLARNCRFLSNFIPIVLLATLSNMDFQATLAKDAAIEYTTKCMTKAGQGSLG